VDFIVASTYPWATKDGRTFNLISNHEMGRDPPYQLRDNDEILAFFLWLAQVRVTH
jgi:hypothetical protein